MFGWGFDPKSHIPPGIRAGHHLTQSVACQMASKSVERQTNVFNRLDQTQYASGSGNIVDVDAP